MNTYLDFWSGAATMLFSQALAGEPQLSEGIPRPTAAGALAFAATLTGDWSGRFTVVLDAGLLELPLMGEGMDQRAGWLELLREVAEAAAGEMLAKTGNTVRVEQFAEAPPQSQVSRAFELRAGDRVFSVLVRDELKPRQAASPSTGQTPATEAGMAGAGAASRVSAPVDPASSNLAALNPGVELLLDIELEASLRFGSREMPLGQLLDLGPGDVVQLDRHVADPVDLIVGDKIVARGEVVLVNGNFGLRVTEVAAPRKRLESIRCLF